MSFGWLFPIGVGCGVVSATLGIGSGVILVPVLIQLFGVEQKSAQGIALAAMVPMALVGATRYGLNPAIPVDWRMALALSVGAIGGAWVGASIAAVLPALTLRRVFGALMLLVAIDMLFTSPKPKDPEPQPSEETEETRTVDVKIEASSVSKARSF